MGRIRSWLARRKERKAAKYAEEAGWMDRGKMCGTVEFINTYMPDMPRKVGCDEVFTNEFLPPRR